MLTLHGEPLTLLIRSPRACLGATLPMVGGLLVLPVPAGKVLIMSDCHQLEEADVTAGGLVVRSTLLDGHFFSSNRTRDRMIVELLRKPGTTLPAEFLFDRLIVSFRQKELEGIIPTAIATRLDEVAGHCRWVDEVLATGYY